MVRTAELAERLDVRLHTHSPRTPRTTTSRWPRSAAGRSSTSSASGGAPIGTWVAHCVMPNAAEVRRLGAAGIGVAHCPSRNLILVVGHRPGHATCARPACTSASASTARRRPTRRRCGWRPARRCCSPSCATAPARRRPAPRSRWRRSAARRASGAPGELGVLSVGRGGRPGGLVAGRSDASPARSPIRSRRWLRCGPASARHTIVAGRLVVQDGVVVHPGLEEMLRRHRAISARLQGLRSDHSSRLAGPVGVGGRDEVVGEHHHQGAGLTAPDRLQHDLVVVDLTDVPVDHVAVRQREAHGQAAIAPHFQQVPQLRAHAPQSAGWVCQLTDAQLTRDQLSPSVSQGTCGTSVRRIQALQRLWPKR